MKSNALNFSGGPGALAATVLDETRPLNFATRAFEPPEYVNSGYWSLRSSAEAKRVCACRVARDGTHTGFRELPVPDRLDRAFIAHAAERSIVGLEGHRSLSGLRASLYNAVTLDAVETLCDALTDFGLRHA